MRLSIALVSYQNEDRTFTRYIRDIRPALAPDWTVDVHCIDNSPYPSRILMAAFAGGYEWQGGQNLLLSQAMNKIVARSNSDYTLYCCTQHGLMIEPTWIRDLIEPFADPGVAMAGCLVPSCTPEEIQADEFTGQGLPQIHIQGGVYLARTDVLRKHPYSLVYPHAYNDLWISWDLMRAGWKLVDVPTVRSVWRTTITDLTGVKYVHDDR